MSEAVSASFAAVSKDFGGRRALDRFSLEVRSGEVVGLLGANGAGKTTALRLLCGLIAPDEGRVEIVGHDVHRDPIEARRNLGYVPDGAPLYANLSPVEHLDLVGSLHGIERSRSASEAARLLDALELRGRERDPVGDFSRGMRQKVAIACALLPHPALLVLDEPLTGLDTGSAQVIQAVMRAWAQRRRAVLVTSHSLQTMERVCDRLVLLQAGRLLAAGTLEELRERAGGGSDLDEVFRSLTLSRDPAEVAAQILGD